MAGKPSLCELFKGTGPVVCRLRKVLAIVQRPLSKPLPAATLLSAASDDAILLADPS